MVMPERLRELLAKRDGEVPIPPYHAQHSGRLIGQDEFRQGPVVVRSTLENTAVVEMDGLRQLVRIRDLEVEPGDLNWVIRRQSTAWPSTVRGRNAAQRNRRPP
jgi:hypothetical protein